MYTMSGITVSEGVSEGSALILLSKNNEDVIDVARFVSVTEEIKKYRNASREFAKKLNNAMSGTVPDKVRDLFGAVSSYITNAGNVEAIQKQIHSGLRASEAAQNILLSKIERFTQEADKDDEEMQVMARELGSLMREFIATIDTEHLCSEDIPHLNGPTVMISTDLTPARFLSLNTDQVRAVILEGGDPNGHLATVLRELRIPAICNVKGALTIKNGERVLVDANRGNILIEPPQDTARAFIAQQDYFNDDDDEYDSDIKVTVAGSMGAITDISRIESYLNHGLGLLRSEFLFLNYRTEPTLEDMKNAFTSIFSKIPQNAPLTARTFDFAGDKKPLFTLDMDESGPLRKYGANVGSQLLKTELQALLLSSVGRDIYIVFPLLTRISEARALKDLLVSVVNDLDSANIPHGTPKVALMIETPAAVLSAKAFAEYGDMFLIGTSSLAEYASAPRPPEDYFTPALSKMVAIACKGAHAAGVKVGIAGRFAMRTELLPFYLALGVSYITTDISSVPKLRKALQQMSDRGIEPNFDLDRYNEIMEISSARDLQRLLFRDDLIY